MVSFITIDATDADVSFGSKADISECPSDVRFTPKSGRLRQGAITEWQSNLRLLSQQAVEEVHVQTAKANRRARP